MIKESVKAAALTTGRMPVSDSIYDTGMKVQTPFFFLFRYANVSLFMGTLTNIEGSSQPIDAHSNHWDRRVKWSKAFRSNASLPYGPDLHPFLVAYKPTTSAR